MRSKFGLVAILSLATTAGCSTGTSRQVELIDLNRVLDVFADTMIEVDGGEASDVDPAELAAAAASQPTDAEGADTEGTADEATEAQQVSGDEATTAEAPSDEPTTDEPTTDELSSDEAAPADGAAPAGDVAIAADQPETVDLNDREKQTKFLAAFRKNLNDAKLISQPISVMMIETGAIQGYADTNNNQLKSADEPELFTIQVDPERQRVIASDTAGNHRDHAYRPHMGFFSGYMLASMMSRQSGYYSGARASAKPDFGRTQMSPQSYHSSALSKARTGSSSSSSVRSRSGSRGFSFGK